MLHLKWLGVNFFQIDLPGGKTLVIDPYINRFQKPIPKIDKVNRCDYLFLTHGHYDHILDAGKVIENFAPRIFCNKTTAENLIEYQGIAPESINTVQDGDVLNLEEVAVEVILGHHTNFDEEYRRIFKETPPAPEDFENYDEWIQFKSHVMHGTKTYPKNMLEIKANYKGGEQLNFVFVDNGGVRIYVAATYPTQKVMHRSKQVRAHITILQCQPGDRLKGIEKETAQIAMNSGCELVIPSHFDSIYPEGVKTDLSVLKSIIEHNKIRFLEPIPSLSYGIEYKKSIGIASITAIHGSEE